MKTVGAFEAKTRFAELLREVERGESFQIQRHNKPVARIVGIDQELQPNTREVLDRIRDLRSSMGASRDEIRTWIKEGRR
jgi:prevent-host-death family protein